MAAVATTTTMRTKEKKKKGKGHARLGAAAMAHLERALTSLRSLAMRSHNGGDVTLLAQVTRAQDALALLLPPKQLPTPATTMDAAREE
mmetsp:Transcript_14527/g.33405  ORF Transcript_14527/g.33405 Transcript_14527/m.33405 type:complete len:89 (-) Transcript_14527:90-356(-)